MEQRFAHCIMTDTDSLQFAIVVSSNDEPYIAIQLIAGAGSATHISFTKGLDVSSLMNIANIFRDAAEAVLKGCPPSERKIERAEDE